MDKVLRETLTKCVNLKFTFWRGQIFSLNKVKLLLSTEIIELIFLHKIK